MKLFYLILLLLTFINTRRCENLQDDAIKLSISSRIHMFLLKLMGKYELFPETTTTESQTSTTATTTTTISATTTRKPRRTKTTTTVSTTDFPFVIARNSMQFIPGRGLVNERVKVSDWENDKYLWMLKEGRIRVLPPGLFEMYTTTKKTTTTPRILTDSDYYSDSEE
ncbi:hypothetical protein ACKWTF_016405 [Chironomus riparius]